MYRFQLLNLALLAVLLLLATTGTQAKTVRTCNPVVTATLTSSYPPNTICETGPTSIVLTCSASAAVTGATYNFYQNGVLQISSSSNIFTVTLSQFSGITSASYTCQVITQAGQCASDQSAAVGIVKCSGPCLPQIAATLTSSYPLNTICTSPPGPSSIVLTCSANVPVTGAIYNFYQDGVQVSSTSSNVYTVTIGQFASITAATFNCQIVTQSGQCTSDFSAAVLIIKCSGGSCTPVPSVVISSSGTLCDNNALITVTVSGCAPGTIYDYTLQRAPLDSSVFSPLTTQTIPCSAGGTTSTTFSVTQTGIYRLSLTTASCSPVLSNTVVFDQTSSVATVTISASGTVCNSPVQYASVFCIVSGFIPGTLTYEFFQSNNPSGFDFNTPFASQATNTLIISNVANGDLYYACRIRNEGGCAIVSTAPASVFVVRSC